MQNVYVSRKALDLLAHYLRLAEAGSAAVILISAQCIGFRLPAELVLS